MGQNVSTTFGSAPINGELMRLSYNPSTATLTGSLGADQVSLVLSPANQAAIAGRTRYGLEIDDNTSTVDDFTVS